MLVMEQECVCWDTLLPEIRRLLGANVTDVEITRGSRIICTVGADPSMWFRYGEKLVRAKPREGYIYCGTAQTSRSP